MKILTAVINIGMFFYYKSKCRKVTIFSMHLISKLLLHFLCLLLLGPLLHRNSSDMVIQLCPIVRHHQTIYIIFKSYLTYFIFKLLTALTETFLDYSL